MSTTFPTTIDDFTDVTCGDSRNPKDVVNNLQDSVEALETKVGVDASATTTSHDYKLSGVTGSDKAASLAGSETLTNKTLTAPAINSPVINSGATLTATSTELNYVDITTPGTAEATKALITDSNKNINLGTGGLSGTGGTLTTPTLILKQSTNPTPTVEGDIQWDTDNNQIKVGDGLSTQTFSPDSVSWWQELGRTTLSVAGDTITVSFSSKKYMRVLFSLIPTGGTINARLTFNNDKAGTNYALNRSNNFDAVSDATSQAFIQLHSSTAADLIFGTFDVLNIQNQEKMVINLTAQSGTAGAGNAPRNMHSINKWANTSDAISRIDLDNTGTGNYAAGSEVIVLGHD